MKSLTYETINHIGENVLNQTQILLAIESFIERIQHDQIDDGQILRSLQELIPAFEQQHVIGTHYGRHVDIFIILMKQVQSYLQRQCYAELDTLLCQQVDVLRALVHQSYPWVGTERCAFQMQEMRNQQSLQNYIAQVLQQKSRSLVVRVDLKYPLNCQEQITAQLFDQHMKILRNRISNGDRCFADLEGFVWAMEQGGKSTGYHCHLLLIYDGHKHQNDYGLAMAVGACWREITQGLGNFSTSHEPEMKQRFEQEGTLAIGRIERKNLQQIQNVLNYVKYFTKPEKYDQRLRAKASSRSRTFGTGQLK